jgi:hypothetical protein
MYGDPTFRGSTLRYNSLALISAGAAMEGPAGRTGTRLDDAICGTLVHGNIFSRPPRASGAIAKNRSVTRAMADFLQAAVGNEAAGVSRKP